MTSSDQSAIVAFLRDAATYGDPSDGVDVIETHAAMIFLVGERAFKIKKAVRLPYLDFSTLERRHAACRREIELNQPTAPEIYRGLEPVTRQASGQLSLGGDGEIVEWTIAMNRFPETAILGHPGKAGMLEGPFLDALAGTVARWHKDAAAGPRTGGAARIRSVAEDILESLSDAPDIIDPDHFGRLSSAVEKSWTAAMRTLDFRARIGLVRRCHGDLHLGNIVELDGRPVPFDALEFDEGLATIDTLYDLAFLLVDLCERDNRPAANRILNRYLIASGSMANYHGLSTLPLFMACRVLVRIRVAIDRLRQQSASATSSAITEIGGKVDDAMHLLTGTPPVLIAVGGLSGSGKTTLARNLAPILGRTPGAIHIRSDVERKALAGVAETERLPPESYTPEAAVRVYRRMARKARLSLLAGQAVVFDAVHLKPEERGAAADLADGLGIPFRGLWVTADDARLIERADRRTRKRRDASDATGDVVRRQLEQDPGRMDWSVIDSSGKKADTLDAALKEVGDLLPET